MIQQLPVYSETEQVAKILKEMLDDLATRLSVIDEVDFQAKKLVDDTYGKMIEWEKKLVVLANGENEKPFSLSIIFAWDPNKKIPYAMCVTIHQQLYMLSASTIYIEQLRWYQYAQHTGFVVGTAESENLFSRRC